MKKVTDLHGKEVIYCPTEKEANAICQLMHNAGLKWCSGKSFLELNRWDRYRDKTCYDIKLGEYADIDFYNGTGYRIYPASDFLPKEFYEVSETYSSDEQPKPKIGQLWECVKTIGHFHVGDIGLLKMSESILFTVFKSDGKWTKVTPETLKKFFRFHSDTTIPSPELLDAYNLLSNEAKKEMQKKYPLIKWSKVKLNYVRWGDPQDVSFDSVCFGVDVIVKFKNCTPEIDYEKGEIRFVKNG